MNAIQNYHRRVDEHIAKVFAANPGAAHCCTKGCFACCSEPVYASEAEVLNIIECMTPEQKAEVKTKLPEWLYRTRELRNRYMPQAVTYRQAAAVCPLLKNGLCSVYENRPFGCRVFFAKHNPQNCEGPARAHQKFAEFGEALFRAIGVPIAVHGKVSMDHLGVMLAEKLLGAECPSASRQEIPESMLHMPPL